jgi:hypothetical protein
MSALFEGGPMHFEFHNNSPGANNLWVFDLLPKWEFSLWQRDHLNKWKFDIEINLCWLFWGVFLVIDGKKED